MTGEQFPGHLLFQWFEQNQKVLETQGFVIHQLLKEPTATWIEPTVFVSFETETSLGITEMAAFGRLSFWFHNKDAINECAEIISIYCLDTSVIE